MMVNLKRRYYVVHEVAVPHFSNRTISSTLKPTILRNDTNNSIKLAKKCAFKITPKLKMKEFFFKRIFFGKEKS